MRTNFKVVRANLLAFAMLGLLIPAVTMAENPAETQAYAQAAAVETASMVGDSLALAG